MSDGIPAAAKDVAAGYKRSSVSTKDDLGRYNDHGFDARFEVSKTANEPHRHFYIVEIDLSDANATPIKHRALDRFKHESAACAIAPNGLLVVEKGDDERGEFIYKWFPPPRSVFTTPQPANCRASQRCRWL